MLSPKEKKREFEQEEKKLEQEYQEKKREAERELAQKQAIEEKLLLVPTILYRIIGFPLINRYRADYEKSYYIRVIRRITELCFMVLLLTNPPTYQKVFAPLEPIVPDVVTPFFAIAFGFLCGSLLGVLSWPVAKRFPISFFSEKTGPADAKLQALNRLKKRNEKEYALYVERYEAEAEKQSREAMKKDSVKGLARWVAGIFLEKHSKKADRSHYAKDIRITLTYHVGQDAVTVQSGWVCNLSGEWIPSYEYYNFAKEGLERLDELSVRAVDAALKALIPAEIKKVHAENGFETDFEIKIASDKEEGRLEYHSGYDKKTLSYTAENPYYKPPRKW